MDQQFLREVLPSSEDWYYVVRVDDPKDNTFPRHSAVNVSANSGQLEYKLRSLMDWSRKKDDRDNKWQHPPTNGIFYTPFTFDTDYLPDGKGNARKEDAHKVGCKVFWLDVDIKPDKQGCYDDQQSALQAVIGACDGQVMPKPSIVVDTGGGFHFYWVLAETLRLGDWLAGSQRLDKYFKDKGVMFDPISRDSARILRVPGTDNMKTGEPRPCRVVARGNHIATSWIDRWPEADEPGGNITGLFAADGSDDLGTQQDGPFFMEDIIEKCGVLGAIAGGGGAGCSEPLWKNVLQFNRYVEDAEDWNVAMSEGHESYTEGGLIAKVSALDPTVKPITCAAFRETYTADFADDPCADCPHRGEFKSPLWLGKKVDRDAKALLPYQPTNLTTRNNCSYVITEPATDKAPAKEMLVCRSEIMSVEAFEEIDKDYHRTPCMKLQFSTGGRVHEDTLNLNTFVRTADARLEFNKIGLAVPNNDAAAKLGDVLSNWHSRLKSAGQCPQLTQVQGWHEPRRGQLSFVIGETVYYPDGRTESTGLAHSPEVEKYCPHGDISKWTEIANYMLAAENPAFHAILAGSFASVLAKPSNLATASMSFYSKDSGIGKSTALQVARSVWSTPDSFHMHNDTLNGVLAVATREPTLPLIWDDPREDQSRASILELLFSASQGRTKQRAGQDGSARSTTELHTMVMVASNAPFMGELNSQTGEAEGKRMLEMQVPRVTLDANTLAFDGLKDNYALAGGVFIEYVIRNLSSIKERINSARDDVVKNVNLTTKERFYRNSVALILVAAEVATELGLVEFDVPMLKVYMYDAIRSSLEAAEVQAQQTSCTNDVAVFVAQAAGGVVDIFPPARSTTESTVLIPPPIHAEHWDYAAADTTGEYRLSAPAFKEWYEKYYGRTFNVKAWLDRAQGEGIATGEAPKRKSLRIGTRGFHGDRNRYCIEVKIAAHATTVSGKPQGLPTPEDASESAES